MVEHSGVLGVPLLPGAFFNLHRGEELGNRLSLGGAAEYLLYGALGVVGVGQLYEGAVGRDSGLQWKRQDDPALLVPPPPTLVTTLQIPFSLALLPLLCGRGPIARPPPRGATTSGLQPPRRETDLAAVAGCAFRCGG